MVTPDLRATFLPNEFPTSNVGLDFDQTFTTLPVASGNNVLTIEPTGSQWTFESTTVSDVARRPQFADRADFLGDFLADLSDEERSFALQTLLASVDTSADSLNGLESAVAQPGLAAAIASRKPGA